MRFRFVILTVSSFALVHFGHPAHANADGMSFWDQNVATSVRNAIAVDEACKPSPYALYRQTCVSNELNITMERSPFEKLTFLDHIALFVNKYKDLNTTQQIMRGIHFKMGVNLSNVYEQEAVLHARLRIRW